MTEDLPWKATQTDGTDFYTGEVDYGAALDSGEPLPVLPGTGEFPGPGWYHLATVPTDCVGMTWPCRLFEVEPADELGDERPRHLNKVGSTSVRVLREVPAHMALGPQGEHVAALIDRARRIDRGAAAWVAAREAAGDAAWVDARAAAWDDAWGDARVTAVDAAWVAAAALDAAGVAAAALVVRDLTSAAHYDVLTGPWRSAIGPIHPDDPDWTETPWT